MGFYGRTTFVESCWMTVGIGTSVWSVRSEYVLKCWMHVLVKLYGNLSENNSINKMERVILWYRIGSDSKWLVNLDFVLLNIYFNSRCHLVFGFLIYCIRVTRVSGGDCSRGGLKKLVKVLIDATKSMIVQSWIGFALVLAGMGRIKELLWNWRRKLPNKCDNQVLN